MTHSQEVTLMNMLQLCVLSLLHGHITPSSFRVASNPCLHEQQQETSHIPVAACQLQPALDTDCMSLLSDLSTTCYHFTHVAL